MLSSDESNYFCVMLDKLLFAIQQPGWRSTIGGLCIHLVLGTLYLWGIITLPITSYLRKFDPTITYNDTIMIYGIQLGTQGATYIVGGLIAKQIGCRRTCMLGGYVLVLGCFLSSLCTSLYQFYITYGIMFGIGLGFNYTPPIGNAATWMPARKGIITGLIVAGFGGGAFIFSFIANEVIFWGSSREDSRNALVGGYYQPNSPAVDNVPTMFCVLGLCYFLLISFGIFLIVEAPLVGSDTAHMRSIYPSQVESGGEGPYQLSDTAKVHALEITSGDSRTAVRYEKVLRDDEDVPASGSQITPAKDSSSLLIRPPSVVGPITEVGPMEMIKSALGWHVASCFVTTTAGGMYVLGTYKTFGVQALGGSSETFLSTVGAVSALFNAGGRVAWGALGDRIGPIEALMLMSSMFSLILLTYPLAPALGQNAFAVWTFFIFGCEGGNFALYMPVVIQLFGIANSSANYAVVSTIYAAASVLNIAYLSTQKVGFEVAIRSMGCLTLVGFVNCCLLRLHVSKKARQSAVRCE